MILVNLLDLNCKSFFNQIFGRARSPSHKKRMWDDALSSVRIILGILSIG